MAPISVSALAELVRLRGQADTLIVGERHPPGAELLPQHAVLLLEIVDRVALLLMDPAGQRDEEKPQGMEQRRHGTQAIKHAGASHPAPIFHLRGNSPPDGHFRNLDRVIGHYAVEGSGAGHPITGINGAL